MQIEIDFEVFQALTAVRQSEEDSYSDVIRRLLKLSETVALQGDAKDGVVPAGRNVLANLMRNAPTIRTGAWIGNVHFPNGTRFRATYKGRTYFAQIKDDVWLGEDDVIRLSPSEAASAISNTKVNGWRFWYGIRPLDDDWRRLDEFRR